MKISQQDQRQQKKQTTSSNVFELQIPGEALKIREQTLEKLVDQNNKTKKYLVFVVFVLILLASFNVYHLVLQDGRQIQAPNKVSNKVLPKQNIQINKINPIDLNNLQRQNTLRQRQNALIQREKQLNNKIINNNKNNNNNNNNKVPFVQPNKKIDIPLKRPTYENNMSLTFSEPTLGMKIPGTKFNNSYANNNYRAFQQMFMQVFKPYNDTDCVMKRYGDRQDGGYLVCDNIMNKSQALLNFGIQGRDNFGCQLTSVYNIPNYQYDCTNPNAPLCSTNKNMNFLSYSCIGDISQQTNHGKYLSLQDIIINRQLTDKHFSIKIDIQGAQWPGFRTLPTKYLDNIDQLFMQIHFFNPHYWGNADIIKAIGQKFITVSLHMNNNGCQYGDRLFPSNAIQVLMVNKKLIKINSQTKSFKLHHSFVPNNANMRECQINGA